ncbi:capping protein-inhibiting regulator of actin dynamics [Dipodomys merriami]|uniref:capping protein-inhibiting regulator of actin dynamics n=1 Tax=Dipodomys merriami TaxID=94247 RepID=UPI003855B8E8
MATEDTKLTKNVHRETTSGEEDKKKGGKFQPFKKLFGKRKKKDTSFSREESVKQKSDGVPGVSNGAFSSDEETLEDSLRSFNYSMGTRAFSHDSIFIPDGGAESEQTVQAMSQDNILGKVKTLQRQLGKNIKFGQRPSNAIPMKKAGSGEAGSEEDLFLTSPMEIVTQQDAVLSDSENKSSDPPGSPSPLNLPGAGSEMEDKVAPVKPSRPKRHFSSAGTIESVNLDAIPLAIARLDNSAAKHKLAVKPKNQRVSRKHRRLAQDRQNDILESQSSLDQNGHQGEDKPICHEEEPEPLDSEEDKRRQEDYWRELEAKCRRQKAEAAEKRRLEEQRLQALERRLWEENQRQELLQEEAEEEGLEEGLKLESEKGQQRGLEEQSCQEQEQREQEAQEHLEAAEQRRLREEAQQLEGLRWQEAERQWQEEEMKETQRLEALKAQQQEAEKRRLEEEARRLKEEETRKLKEEEAKRLEEEARRLEEEKAKRLEEEKARRLEEEKARRLEEEKARRLEEEKARRLEEEKARRLEEEKARRLEEEKARRLEEEKARRLEEEKARRLEEEKARRLEEEKARRLEEEKARRLEEEKARRLEEEKARRLEEEARLQELEEERLRRQEQEEQEQAGQREQLSKHGEMEAGRPEADRPAQLEDEDSRQPPSPTHSDPEERPEDRGSPAPQRQSGNPEEPQGEEAEAADRGPGTEGRGAGPRRPAEADRERRVEELRWQEVDERQSTPRPYTFQVSSGGRQILFPKVNLSPVTPAQDAGPGPAAAPPAPRAGVLPSALSIPHTAILVTGAQLCGPAVNLSQIKDTACKSLLGLSDEKRPPGPPGAKARPPPPEAPGGNAALAEWASIRSRILKNAEGDARGGGDREPPRPGDEPAPRGRCDSRGSLRRNPPANVKFSIMPAWQKFSDGAGETSRPSAEAEGSRKRPGPGPGEEAAAPQEPPRSPDQPDGRPEPADTSQGCKFAKDLPSFLVPGLPAAPGGDGETPDGGGGPAEAEPAGPGAPEEKASPFGIKLRRTNYSLRFHCDQQAEQKKKKRHSSTGDGADGASGDREPQAPGVVAKAGPALPPGKKPAPASRRDGVPSPSGGGLAAPGPPTPAGSPAPAAPEHDKAAARTPPVQKPALAPKPTGQTPPSSPLSKLSRPYLVELLARRAGKADSEPPKEAPESGEPQPPSPPPCEDSKGQKGEEEEGPERRPPSSPLLPASQQERPAQTPEAGRKDKPLLQSRHSLDGSRLTDKAETAQPLWITLALQKQKGFREQQATREERKQAREAKQVEKLSKENVSVSSQPGSSSVSRAGSLHKSTAQPEEKKPETAVSRLQRREQLKKANTLPTSVTVEISDSAPPAPLVKEVTKRFSTPDAAPVSTEPAWLALAKRKAKAWSDCPQIINFPTLKL